MKRWKQLLAAAFSLPLLLVAAEFCTIPIDAELMNWNFSGGPKDDRAGGSAICAGNGILRLSGDFRKGGSHVAVSRKASFAGANELRFRVRGEIGRIGVRLTDSAGQIHQHFISVGFGAGNAWKEISVPVAGSPRSRWGGAADGKFRGEVTAIGFAVHKADFRNAEGCCEITGIRLGRTEVRLEKPLDLSAYDARKITVNGAASAEKLGRTLAVEIAGNQDFTWPGISLTPQSGRYFDLSEGNVLAIDVTNRETYPVIILCQIENLGADGKEFCAKGGRAFAAGESATLRVRYTRNDTAAEGIRFEGVMTPPEGIPGGSNLDVKKITNIMLWSSAPRRRIRFSVNEIRVEGKADVPSGALKSASAFYPAIDTYGQYRHREWSGKTHADADLAAAKEAERHDLTAHSRPSGWNRYGGWADGPSFKATGSFYPVKYEGKWYLVDPSGKLFFSHGIDQFRGTEATGVTFREHYFEDLPDRNDPRFSSLWKTIDPAPGKNFYSRKKVKPVMFDFLQRNLIRKYGANYEPDYRRLLHARARSWGINTMGNWTWPTYLRGGSTPYVFQIYCSGGPSIKGHQGNWQHFEDVFDPRYEACLVKAIEQGWEFAAGDPMCIGVFVDNEHRFGGETALAEAVLQSPPDQAAKREFRHRLERKYRSIEALNAAWGSSYASFGAFLESTSLPGAAARNDLKEFNSCIVRRYFEGARNAVRKALPDKLYLGCRFAGDPGEQIARIAAEYCDVMSYNIYQYSLSNFALPEGVDKPVLIGEFHFGTTAGGNAHPGLVACADNAERAAAYTRYVESALAHPSIVGCHYYRLYDEPASGRSLDDENMGIGFLDICDRPVPEMVEAARGVARKMYRSGAEE
ncbi:MAG: hypothetical protein HPZ91_13685 [Lentisphaeria bacterium]|nr:hypothetical protein [Lentisphaeria bacterium]